MILIKVILSRIKPEDVGQDDKRMGGGGVETEIINNFAYEYQYKHGEVYTLKNT